MRFFTRFLGVLAVLWLSPFCEAGPTHQLLSTFDVPAQNPGYGTLVSGPNGYYWGTTQGGGAASYGTVFKMKADGTDLQTVVFFTGTSGANKGRAPYAGLISDGAGFFWGTTKEGGAGNFGTVFKVNASTGALTTVLEFTNTGGSFKGAYPFAGLVSDGAGFLWGTTQQGGALSLGTVFKVNVSTGAMTTVVEFTHDQASNRGSYPYAALVSNGAGSLWGTTNYGGTAGVGTIFKINTSTGVLTTVVEFTENGATNKGAYPWAALMNDGAGSFWGTTTAGGALGHGTLFKVNATTGVLTTVVEFTNNGASNRGRTPSAGLVSDGLGFHWGTTTSGGAGTGTVFKVNASTGVLTTLVEFTNNGATNKGASPYAALLNDGAGSLLGTTYAGATGGTGTVFKVNASTGVLTTLVEFSASTQFGNGRAPYAGLASDGAGSLWGSNVNGGGTSGSGTVFKLNPVTNALTAPVKFTGNAGANRGAYSYGTLASDGLGFYWGTTQGGGATGNGTIFKVSASTGVMTSMLAFTSNGASNRGAAPAAALRSDGSGFLWGTTQTGGTGGFGTLFKVNRSTGVLTTLVDFTSNGAANKGANPSGPLASDGAGFFWGTTQGGGAAGFGTIFKINASTGVLTTVLEFTHDGASNRGSSPWAGLVGDGAGFFWGTTQFGGTGTFGTVFKVDAATGALVTVVDFTNTVGPNKGSRPTADLMNDGAGFFWGTTSQGGASGNGTVFKLNASTGGLTTLVEFTGAGTQALAGTFPGYGALLKYSDGNLYGTTASGGPGGGGTLYRLAFGPTAVTQPAGTITSTSAVLNGTINPNGIATAASFEFGTHPLLTGAAVISAGTTTAGTAPEAVTAAVNGLLPGTTYYARVRGLNAENPNLQSGAIVSFTTVANQPPVAAPTTVAVPAQGAGSVSLASLVSDPDHATAALTFAIVSATGVTVTPVSAGVFDFAPNGAWTGSGSFTYRVTDPAGASANAIVTVVDVLAPSITVPPNLTVEATSADGAAASFTPTATDNVAVTSLTSAPASGSVFLIGTSAVTVTAMDRAGNSATGTFNVTVQDTTAPVLAVPGNVIAEAASGVGAIVNYPAATATDPVGVTALTYSQASGSAFAIGTTTVTVTATDQAGNSATGTFSVAVQDTTPPVVTPPGNVFVNASGAGGMVVNYPPATATDAVGVTGVTYSHPSGAVFASGTTVVVVTASDLAGHTGSASFTVTVNSPPVGGALSVSASSNLQQGDAVQLTASGWTDPQMPLSYEFFLGGASLGAAGTSTQLSMVAPGPGTHTVSVRVTDALGAAAGAARSLVVKAGIASWREENFGTSSEIGPAADLSDPNGNGLVNLLEYALHGAPLSAPGTANLNPILGRSAGNALQLSFKRYLDRPDLTLVVVAGNSPTGPWTELAMSIAGGAFTAVVPGAGVLETGTGGSRNVTVTDLYPATDPAHPQRFVRLKARLGNSPPAVVLLGANPQTVEVAATYNDSGATATDPEDGSLPAFMGGNTVIPNVVGTYYVTWQATDGAGNIGITTRTVNVVDTTAPLITPPGSVIVEATSNAGAPVTYDTAVATDVAGVASLTYSKARGSNFAIGMTTVTVTAVDQAGNSAASTFTVTVRDTTAPALTAPAHVIAEATSSSGAMVAYPAAAASDLVGVTSLTYSKASGSNFGIGTTTVSVTARDQAGNSTSSSFTVTVWDATPPVVTLPGNVVAEASSNTGAIVAYPAATATDFVSVASLTYSRASGSNFPIGTTMVTVTATDLVGNSAAGTFAVTVRDTTPPALTPPGNMILEATGSDGTVVNFPAVIATDLVGVTAVIHSPASGSAFPIGTATVTVTAMDQAGNSASEFFTVTVQDTTAPLITPPGDITAEAAGAGGAIVEFPAADASDIVGVATLDYSRVSGSTFGIGTTPVLVTAMDQAGNIATSTFNITVQDTTAPELTLPNNVMAEATSGLGAIVNYPNATATDLVGVSALTYSRAPGSVFSFGTTTVTVTALDAAGNSATGSFTVAVQDTTPPVVTPPGNVLINTSGPAGMVVNYPPATATDAVGVTGVTYSQASGTVFASGTTVVEVTASDTAGNPGRATFTVTVNAPPTGGALSVSAAPDLQQGGLVQLNATGWADAQGPLSYEFFLGGASLGAAGLSSTRDLAAPAPGTYTAGVRVTDGLGAFVEATQSVTVHMGIATWRQAHFGSTMESGAAADLADPNRNGLVNLVEYALNGDPMGATAGKDVSPEQGWSAGKAMQLTFTRHLDRTDLTLIVIGADSPTGPWTDLATSIAGGPFEAESGATAVETGTGATRSVTVTDLFPATDPLHPRRFLRLKVRR